MNVKDISYFSDQTFIVLNTICHVLALGESLNTYIPNPEHSTIGVNDIFRKHKTNLLVVCDPMNRFTPERRQVIFNSRPDFLFTSFDDWKVHPKYKRIQLAKGRGRLDDLDTPDVFPYSNNSPFVACVIAYKLGAKKIILHGADFRTHPALSKPINLQRIKTDFSNLVALLSKRGVELNVSSPVSFLSDFVPLLKC